MGMDVFVYAVADDDDIERKKEAWDACLNAGVEPPEELRTLFGGGEDPRHTLLTSAILHRGAHKHPSVEDAEELDFGTLIHLDRLPPGTKAILIDVSV